MNTLNIGMKVNYNQPTYKQGAWYLGLDLGGFIGPEDGMRGSLTAIDPVTGKALWEAPSKVAVLGRRAFHRRRPGVHRRADRRIHGLRCGHRQEALAVPDRLRHHRAAHHLGTQGPAVRDGHQRGSHRLRSFGNDPTLQQVPAGSSVWTFRLSD